MSFRRDTVGKGAGRLKISHMKSIYTAACNPPIEACSQPSNTIFRSLNINGMPIRGEMVPLDKIATENAKSWYIQRLKGARPRWQTENKGRLGVLDLFSGCGGLSFGVKEAAESLGYQPVFECGIDQDPMALEVYRRNMKALSTSACDVSDLVGFDIWENDPKDPHSCTFVSDPEPIGLLEKLRGKVDMIVGGPPCQGHSNLNNHTRRADPRNLLYLTMPAIAVALDAKIAIVENVPEVIKDQHSVVDRAVALFKSRGYKVTDSGPVNAFDCGVAQTRRRHFLIATKGRQVDVASTLAGLERASMTVWDAIGDLSCMDGERNSFDSPSQLSGDNQMRVEWLHANDKMDLPNELRPDCHKDGHTYPSIYGRLHKDQPSLTVTGGFLSPGRGRYVHPTLPRALTPHEGARLQGFPDDFLFLDSMGRELTKKAYSKLIGNAVPPPLAFVLALSALISIQE